MVHKLNLGVAMMAALGASVLVSDSADARHRRGGGSFGGFFSRSNDNGCGSHGGGYVSHRRGHGSSGGGYRSNGCGSHGGGYVHDDCCGGDGYSHRQGHHDGGYVDSEGVYIEGGRYGDRPRSETRYYGGTYQDAPRAPEIDVDVDSEDRLRSDRDRDRADRDRDFNEDRRDVQRSDEQRTRANDRTDLGPPSPENRSASENGQPDDAERANQPESEDN